MKPVIEVTDISKSYQISHQSKASYDTIKDDFAKLIKKPFGGGSQNEQETFWALKDINFQVNQGETFGIVGKNGSGKSTLLKILSRIVDPTTGSIRIRGKVASLLEVGTGFHPELTGRENIYFNGSMIGMSKQEIAKKFNEIVEFSEVEKFLDTPVKFYSSGMFVRLAFSVAAHLDSEILILDEVLSVGDAGFQKKSMDKMLGIAKEGRTILFVSHSASAVRDICTRAILLHDGKIKSIGQVDKVLFDYTGSIPAQPDAGSSVLKELEIHSSEVKDSETLTTDSPFTAEVEFTLEETLPNLLINFFVDNSAGNYVLHARNNASKNNPFMQKGKHKVTLQFPRLSLNSGVYSTWFRFAAMKEDGEYALDAERLVFEVKGKSEDEYSAVNLPASWETKTAEKK